MLNKKVLQNLVEKIKQIKEFICNTFGDKNYKYHIKHKHCITCANRIAERDFKILDGIVCNHPTNKKGKDRFRCYTYTCKHWKQETNKYKIICQKIIKKK